MYLKKLIIPKIDKLSRTIENKNLTWYYNIIGDNLLDCKIVCHLNSLVYSLCDKAIIIVISQVNTIPYDYGNLNRFTFTQHVFF